MTGCSVKLPESAVAVDRLFDIAITQGNLPSALKAARAQQLANSGDAALPLIFFVDAWRRNNWVEAEMAVRWNDERSCFWLFIAHLGCVDQCRRSASPAQLPTRSCATVDC